MRTTEYRTVVAGVDGSQHALLAVRWAAVEASRRGVPLRLLNAFAWPVGDRVGDAFLGVDYRRLLHRAAGEHLAAAARVAADVAPGLPVEQVVRQGFPVPMLRAASARAGLLVLGGRGVGGFAGLTAGSVAEHVVLCADCPVVVVRESAPGATPSRDAPIVLGVDGSEAGEVAVAFAFDAAARWRVSVVAVHACSDTTLDPRLEAV